MSNVKDTNSRMDVSFPYVPLTSKFWFCSKLDETQRNDKHFKFCCSEIFVTPMKFQQNSAVVWGLAGGTENTTWSIG